MHFKSQRDSIFASWPPAKEMLSGLGAKPIADDPMLVHGLRLLQPAFPFYRDTAACFLGGDGILCLSRFAKLDGG